MLCYAQAKSLAQGSRNDWNEREMICSATITWVDNEYEYELEAVMGKSSDQSDEFIYM